jgi:hypothetical protein
LPKISADGRELVQLFRPRGRRKGGRGLTVRLEAPGTTEWNAPIGYAARIAVAVGRTSVLGGPLDRAFSEG